MEGLFVYETVKKVCTNLKLGVSGGFDQVTYEHMKYGAQSCGVFCQYFTSVCFI